MGREQQTILRLYGQCFYGADCQRLCAWFHIERSGLQMSESTPTPALAKLTEQDLARAKESLAFDPRMQIKVTCGEHQNVVSETATIQRIAQAIADARRDAAEQERARKVEPVTFICRTDPNSIGLVAEPDEAHEKWATEHPEASFSASATWRAAVEWARADERARQVDLAMPS